MVSPMALAAMSATFMSAPAITLPSATAFADKPELPLSSCCPTSLEKLPSVCG